MLIDWIKQEQALLHCSEDYTTSNTTAEIVGMKRNRYPEPSGIRDLTVPCMIMMIMTIFVNILKIDEGQVSPILMQFQAS